MNRHRPPKNLSTLPWCSNPQEGREQVRKEKPLRDPTQSLYKAHWPMSQTLRRRLLHGLLVLGVATHPAKPSGFCYNGKRGGRISEYSHRVPTASKQDALQLSWHDLPRDSEGPGTSVAGKTRLVGTGNREAMGIIRTSP